MLRLDYTKLLGAPELPSRLQTLRDIMRFAVSCFESSGVFYGHGTQHAWDEAAWLLYGSLHLPLGERPGDAVLDALLLEEEKRLLLDNLRRRVLERIPTAYLLGEAWFAGQRYTVNPSVLIPRSPFAEIIQAGFEPFIDPDAIAEVLDLCTGSGCMAIATALALTDVGVDAVDLSSEALAVAQRNIDRHHMDARVRLFQGDLFEALPLEQSYDVIISNPPYVGFDEWETLPPEYHHEPRMALVPDDAHPLSLVSRILKEAADYLTPHGVLMLEVGAGGDLLRSQYPDVPFQWVDLQGEGEIFVLSREQLMVYAPLLSGESDED